MRFFLIYIFIIFSFPLINCLELSQIKPDIVSLVPYAVSCNLINCFELPHLKPDIISLVPYAISWYAHTFITQQMPDHLSLPSSRVQLVNMSISAIFIGTSWFAEAVVKGLCLDQKPLKIAVAAGLVKPLFWITLLRSLCKVGELCTLSVMHTTVLSANGFSLSKKHLLGTGLYFFTMQLLSVGLFYKYKNEPHNL